ncbi:unnamed protein product [Leuciscus chuanchicus]
MATKKSSSPQKSAEGCKRLKTLEDDVASIVNHAIEEQEAMRKMVSRMLTEAIQSALKPFKVFINENNTALRSMKEEMDSLSKNVASITTKVDNLQGSLRSTKKDANLCLSQLEQMQRKCNDLEDRSRRNNVRLVNLPTGMEGDDPVGFLQKMLPKWIPDLSTRSSRIEIDRVHRVYSSSNSPKPRSLIFRLLRYPDRQAILQGARKAKPTLPGGAHLEFFADYSHETAQKRKAFSTASESKREQFRRYLEKAGVLDSLTNVLVALYEETEKPNNALDFIKHHLGVAGPEEDDSETLRLELTDLQKKYDQLLAENKDLRNRLLQYEPAQEEATE